MTNVLDKNQNTHIIFNIFFNRAVYERMWKNMVDPDRSQMTIYEGHLESKERFAIKKYLLIIGKKKPKSA